MTPPRRGEASNKWKGRPACWRVSAAQSPAIPPPTMTTGPSATGGTDDAAQRGDEGRRVVERLRALERDPDSGRLPPGLHVDVEQDLRVIADEADTAHEDAPSSRLGERRDGIVEGGPQPRLGGAARTL